MPGKRIAAQLTSHNPVERKTAEILNHVIGIIGRESPTEVLQRTELPKIQPGRKGKLIPKELAVNADYDLSQFTLNYHSQKSKSGSVDVLQVQMEPEFLAEQLHQRLSHDDKITPCTFLIRLNSGTLCLLKATVKRCTLVGSSKGIVVIELDIVSARPIAEEVV